MFNEPLRLRSSIAANLWTQIHQPYYKNKEPEAKSGFGVKYVGVFKNNEYYGVYQLSESVDRKQLKLKKSKNKSIYGELYKANAYEGGPSFESLKEVNRPNADENWEFFDAAKEITWKTGTSFGFRDAWSIGVTKDYVVGVWVGNADGEGRPGLVGLQTAAPILLDVFDKLPNSSWFEKPFDEMTQIEICSKSGNRATKICEEKKLSYIQNTGLKTEPCPFNININIDRSRTYKVNTSCESLENIQQKSWFVLPPLQEYYYKKQNPFYKP
jgi:penicillin-binding protein 1C